MRNRKTLAVRLGAAVLGGALLAGIGTSTALAAPAHTTAVGVSAVPVAARAAAPVPAPPPPTHPDASKAYFDFYLYNNTQYEWTLEPGWTHSFVKNDRGEFVNSPWVNGPPPEKIAPRSGISMAKLARTGSQNGQDVWLSYAFTDNQGAKRMMNLRATDLHALPSYSLRLNWDHSEWVEDSSVFYTGWQQYAPVNSVGGFWRFTPGECATMALDKASWEGVYRGVLYKEDDPVRWIGQDFSLEADGAQARARMTDEVFAAASFHIDDDGTLVYRTRSEATNGSAVITMRPVSCGSDGEVTSASLRMEYTLTPFVSDKPLGKRPWAPKWDSAPRSTDTDRAALSATEIPARTASSAAPE